MSAFILLWAAPAVAASGIESTLTLSDVHPGSKQVIYSWDLAVSTHVEARSMRVSVAEGTSGTPSIYLADGLPSGTLSFDGRTIHYAFDSAAQIPAGTKIILAVAGLTNPTVAGDFTSQVRLGDLEDQTQTLTFDAKAGTRAMVFVTAEAARISREDTAVPRSTGPVLMTNEQIPSKEPAVEMTSPSFLMVPSVGLIALLMGLAIWMLARRTFQVA